MDTVLFIISEAITCSRRVRRVPDFCILIAYLSCPNWVRSRHRDGEVARPLCARRTLQLLRAAKFARGLARPRGYVSITCLDSDYMT